jgi:hypothetical protein
MVVYETEYGYEYATATAVAPRLQTRWASAADEGPGEQPEAPQGGDGMILGLALLAVLMALGLVWQRRSRPESGNEP